MALEDRYRAQVDLLVRTLPILESEPCFALKGGTAINLFVRDLARLSVDIDLAYLPIEPREQALVQVHAALQRMVDAINRGGVADAKARMQASGEDQLRFLVSSRNAQIKVEVSPVLRGALHAPEIQRALPSVRQQFGDALVPVLALPDLYGGKICAALDRQHPRDWFDVLLLLDADELSREIFEGFLVYLVSHGRPMNELLAGRWKPMQETFQNHFLGMSKRSVTLEQLEAARERLLAQLRMLMTEQDKAFLLSIKAGEPDWSLYAHERIRELPAVQWELLNVRNMKPAKRLEALERLEAVLATYGKH